MFDTAVDMTLLGSTMTECFSVASLPAPKFADTCWYFDRLMMRPVRVRFCGVNHRTDGWYRFEFIDPNTCSSKYTSCPVEDWGRNFCPTKKHCIMSAMQLLVERMMED